jgi:hypothetical protein
MDLYQLNKQFPVDDYQGREVFVPNWVLKGVIDRGMNLEDFMIDKGFLFGIYCTEDDDETQYFEYFDKDTVPDAFTSIYFWNREPTCAAFRIHWAETEGKRYTGQVFSTAEIFQHLNDVGEAMEYVGDWHPDDLIGAIYEQFQRENS